MYDLHAGNKPLQAEIVFEITFFMQNGQYKDEAKNDDFLEVAVNDL